MNMEITFLQLTEDSLSLAEIIPKLKYKYVFGIPTGGLIPAFIVAKKIGATMLSLKEFTEGDYIKDANVLIVDDLVDGGTTLKKFNPKEKYDVAVVYIKKHSPKNLTRYLCKEMPNEWLTFPHEKDSTGIEEHIERVLEYIGEDTNREGLIDTPKRVARMYKEIFRGYKKENKPKITTFENGKDGVVYDQMILDEGDFYSHCEHHMVPFFGKYYFAYIPDKIVLGLSKVARIVDYHSAKLQIQERLVKDVVDDLEKACNPKGIAFVIKAQHLCKTMRGVKKQGFMTTSEVRGMFRDNLEVREEFFKLIKL